MIGWGNWWLAPLLTLALLFAALAALFWAAAGLSAFGTGGGWPAAGLTDTARALIALPEHLGEPDRAWEPRLRRQMAPAGPFWVTFWALVAIVGLGLAMLGPRRRRRRGAWWWWGRSSDVPSARWARAGDLRELLVAGPERGRLILGRYRRRLIASEPLASVLVVAPPRSYKTTGLAIPALLEHQGPAIATSIRGDLLEATLARRQELGEVMIFDPTGASGLPATPWSPLGSSESWRGAQRMAHWLCSVSRTPGRGEIADSDFWYRSAAKLLAPHLLAAAAHEGEIGDVVGWIDTQEEREVRDLLIELGEQHAVRALKASWAREPRQRSSIYTTVETVLEAYEDPVVLANAASSDISPARLLDGGAHTLYVVGPPNEQERLAPLFAAMLEEMIAVAYDSSLASGPLDPSLLVVGDELANIAPIRSLPQLASTGGGQGIQLVSIFQDLAQIEARWGRSWRTVANSHRSKLFGAGLGDPHSLSYVRQLSGDSEYHQLSHTSGERRGESMTDATTHRALAPEHLVRECEPGTAVLIHGHLPPAQITLRSWFADRGLRRLADGTGAPLHAAR